jgi:hypothetical protein
MTRPAFIERAHAQRSGHVRCGCGLIMNTKGDNSEEFFECLGFRRRSCISRRAGNRRRFPSTTGCFGPTCTSFSSFANLDKLTFTGTNFGATTIDPAGSLTLGLFEVSNDLLNALDNRAFRLNVNFSEPAGASPNPEIFSATLDGNIDVIGGQLLIDFSNAPIQFTVARSLWLLRTSISIQTYSPLLPARTCAASSRSRRLCRSPAPGPR